MTPFWNGSSIDRPRAQAAADRLLGRGTVSETICRPRLPRAPAQALCRCPFSPRHPMALDGARDGSGVSPAHRHRERRPLPALPSLSIELRGRVPLPPARAMPSGALRARPGPRRRGPVVSQRRCLGGVRHPSASAGIDRPTDPLWLAPLRGHRRQIGQDLFLPDCFGFSQALPTLAAHCGIVGFSTQKLRRGADMRSAFGVPFPFGLWLGPDGSELAGRARSGRVWRPGHCRSELRPGVDRPISRPRGERPTAAVDDLPGPR